MFWLRLVDGVIERMEYGMARVLEGTETSAAGMVEGKELGNMVVVEGREDVALRVEGIFGVKQATPFHHLDDKEF